MTQDTTQQRPALDPRVRALIGGRPPVEQLMFAMMADQMGPERFAEVSAAVLNAGPDVNRQIEGQPYHHWLGKSRRDLLAENNGDEEKTDRIVSALKESGVDVPDRLSIRGGREFAEDRAARGVVMASAPPPDSPFAGGAPMGAGATLEPTFGKDQEPVSEIWNEPDDALKRRGLNDEDIFRVRTMRRDAAQRAAAVRTTFPGGDVRSPAPSFPRNASDADRADVLDPHDGAAPGEDGGPVLDAHPDGIQIPGAGGQAEVRGTGPAPVGGAGGAVPGGGGAATVQRGAGGRFVPAGGATPPPGGAPQTGTGGGGAAPDAGQGNQSNT